MKKINWVFGAMALVPTMLYFTATLFEFKAAEYVVWLTTALIDASIHTGNVALAILKTSAHVVNQSLIDFIHPSYMQLSVTIVLVIFFCAILFLFLAKVWKVSFNWIFLKFLFAVMSVVMSLYIAVSNITVLDLPVLVISIIPVVVALAFIFELPEMGKDIIDARATRELPDSPLKQEQPHRDT